MSWYYLPGKIRQIATGHQHLPRTRGSFKTTVGVRHNLLRQTAEFQKLASLQSNFCHARQKEISYSISARIMLKSIPLSVH